LWVRRRLRAARSRGGSLGFLLWGLAIGQLYQDLYARAWRIHVGTVADQALFAIWFFVATGKATAAGSVAWRLDSVAAWPCGRSRRRRRPSRNDHQHGAEDVPG